MDIRPSRRRSVIPYSKLKSGFGWPWSGMAEYRFSAGEVRTIQTGYVLVVLSVVLFAILATTTILPALNNQYLHQTECRITRSDIVRSAGFKNGHDEDVKLCLKIYAVYQTTSSWDDPRYPAGFVGDGEIKIHEDWQHRNGINPKLSGPKSNARQVVQALVRYNELQNVQVPCTLQPTSTTRNVNTERLSRELSHLQKTIGRPGIHLPCYYDPGNLAYVIISKHFNRDSITYGILWPGILLLLGLTLIVIVRCCISRFKSKVRYSSKETNSLVASIARESGKTKSVKGAASDRGTGNFGMGITRFNVAR